MHVANPRGLLSSAAPTLLEIFCHDIYVWSNYFVHTMGIQKPPNPHYIGYRNLIWHHIRHCLNYNDNLPGYQMTNYLRSYFVHRWREITTHLGSNKRAQLIGIIYYAGRLYIRLVIQLPRFSPHTRAISAPPSGHVFARFLGMCQKFSPINVHLADTLSSNPIGGGATATQPCGRQAIICWRNIKLITLSSAPQLTWKHVLIRLLVRCVISSRPMPKFKVKHTWVTINSVVCPDLRKIAMSIRDRR